MPSNVSLTDKSLERALQNETHWFYYTVLDIKHVLLGSVAAYIAETC